MSRVEHLAEGVTLYLGDCRDVMPTLGRVDAVVTDPPYEFVPMGGGLGGKRQVYKDIYKADLHIGFEVSDLLPLSDSITVFCAKAQIKRMIEFAEANGFRWNLTTFNKTNPTPLVGANYLPDAEYIFHFWKGVRLGGAYADKSRFWVGPASGDSSLHPTIKPVALMAKLIRVATDGPLVLDPFMGSGTTGIAAVKIGRQFIGIEKEPKYFELAIRRIQDALRRPDMFISAPASKPVQEALQL